MATIRLDGHNLKSLDKAISKGSFYSNLLPTIVHIKTTKGKGLEDLESSDPKSHPLEEANKIESKETFSDIASSYLWKKISKDKDIKVISAAMLYSSNLNNIAKEFALNCDAVAISDAHAVSQAAVIE